MHFIDQCTDVIKIMVVSLGSLFTIVNSGVTSIILPPKHLEHLLKTREILVANNGILSLGHRRSDKISLIVFGWSSLLFPLHCHSLLATFTIAEKEAVWRPSSAPCFQRPLGPVSMSNWLARHTKNWRSKKLAGWGGLSFCI